MNQSLNISRARYTQIFQETFQFGDPVSQEHFSFLRRAFERNQPDRVFSEALLLIPELGGYERDGEETRDKRTLGKGTGQGNLRDELCIEICISFCNPILPPTSETNKGRLELVHE